LSPRLREVPTVSMPIQWSQVKAGLDPTRYTMRTVPALLKKSTAWSDYCDAEAPLEPAIRKLVGGTAGAIRRRHSSEHARARA
jgi:bifunctional non-homologous end joining protein LigD